MGGESWSMTAKLCDSCKTTSANLFCRADSAFLCMGCDAKIHAANKLASRHARVWLCEVCEHAPASVTCKADAAALCVTCDRDIHSANPLARRHERFPVVPFYDSATAAAKSVGGSGGDEKYLSDVDGSEAEEAEAASWLLTNPNPNKTTEASDLKPSEYLFNDMDSYIDLDIVSEDQKPHQLHHHHHHHNHQQPLYTSGTDGVVPVQAHPALVNGFPAYDTDFSGSAKPFMYNFTSQSISQSVSSSSLDVGVVPDYNAISDVSNTLHQNATAADAVPNPISGIDREARVLRYREKRKNRKFEKTIRYASRKAYAETRPRIKGRFAKRSEIAVEVLITADASSYGVVPSY